MTPAPLGVAILAATFAFAQAHSGLEVVVKVEARRLAGEPASELVSRALANGFPEGAVTETYLTDGRAVRGSASGPIFGRTAASILLAPGEDSHVVYVLNLADQTYRRVPETRAGRIAGNPQVAIEATGEYRTMFGYQARKVRASVQWTGLTDDAPLNGQRGLQVRADFENWCATEPSVPAAMATMMDVMRRLFGGFAVAAQYRERCPLPLESALRVSVLQGFEIVSTVQSIRRTRPSPDLFRIPPTYREIAGEGRTASR